MKILKKHLMISYNSNNLLCKTIQNYKFITHNKKKWQKCLILNHKKMLKIS